MIWPYCHRTQKDLDTLIMPFTSNDRWIVFPASSDTIDSFANRLPRSSPIFPFCSCANHINNVHTAARWNRSKLRFCLHVLHPAVLPQLSPTPIPLPPSSAPTATPIGPSPTHIVPLPQPSHWLWFSSQWRWRSPSTCSTLGGGSSTSRHSLAYFSNSDIKLHELHQPAACMLSDTPPGLA